MIKRNEEERAKGWKVDDWISKTGTAGLVSIVVPTHNRARLLAETLESLTAQCFRPLEIVVVDDGSEDETPEVVHSVAEQAPDGISIEFVRQEQAGAPTARNTGAVRSAGEFIIFMDDDDVVTNDFVTGRHVALASNLDATVAYGPWKAFIKRNNQYKLVGNRGQSPYAGDRWLAFLRGWDLLLQGCLFRRELVARVGPWKSYLHKSQDLDYKARLLANEQCRPVFAQQGSVFYRLHSKSITGSLTTTKLESHFDVVRDIEAMTVDRSDYEQLRSALAGYLWYQAFWMYATGDLSRGQSLLERARFHDSEICRRNGLLPTVLDRVGMSGVIGPGFYMLVKIKGSLGLSQSKVDQVLPALPTSTMVAAASNANN